MLNRIPYIGRVLYSLKKRFGMPVDLYILNSTQTNASTGDVTSTITKVKIRRGIALPTASKRFFSYDRSYISSDKNFTYGALFDLASREFIIDRKDLPSTYVCNNNDYIICNHSRYKIKEFHEFEDNKGILFLTEELKGKLTQEFFEVSVKDVMTLTDSGGTQ